MSFKNPDKLKKDKNKAKKVFKKSKEAEKDKVAKKPK